MVVGGQAAPAPMHPQPMGYQPDYGYQPVPGQAAPHNPYGPQYAVPAQQPQQMMAPQQQYGQPVMQMQPQQ